MSLTEQSNHLQQQFSHLLTEKEQLESGLATVKEVSQIFLLLDVTVASRAVFVTICGSEGRAGGNAFGASYKAQKR